MAVGLAAAIREQTGMILLERLGTGPCFETWQAVAYTGVPALVKVFREPWFLDAAELERFHDYLDELTMIAWHPHLNRLVDWWNVSGRLVLWYQEPGSEVLLGSWARSPVPTPPEKLFPSLTDIASALDYVGRMGSFHGYLKPHHLLESLGTRSLVETGLLPLRFYLWNRFRVRVSWEFVPPELQRGEKPSPTTDLYSLGLIYLMFRTGWLPAAQESPQVAQEDEVLVQVGRLEKWERDLVQPLLAPSPAERPQFSPLDWVLALRQRYFEMSSVPSGQKDVHHKVTELVLEDRELTTVELSRLQPGGTLWLTSHVYHLREPLVLWKPLRICGQGKKPARIVVHGCRVGMEILACGEVVLENLAFQHKGEEPADIVRVRAGKLLAERCDFKGNGADQGVNITERGEGIIRHCVFRGLDTGIAVGVHGRAQIENCRCEGNQFAGIVVNEHSQAVIANCEILENGEQGIYVGLHAAAELVDNRCLRNKDAGIAVFDSARVSVQRNACALNRGNGINIASAKHAILTDNTCSQNGEYGIGCYSGETVAITYNRCVGNLRGGIDLGELPSVQVRANTVAGNHGPGIEISTGLVSYESAEPEQKRVSAASVLVSVNVSSRNDGPGVWVRKEAQVTLRGNQCINNGGPGILFSDSSGGRATGNRCQGNAGGGIRVEDSAAPFLDGNLTEDENDPNTGMGKA
ncbi:hypothetical protein THTE_0819 [Thermogutta terrifontis]|uniref:Protein kinase domain-containing protein n=1 Tax=Thermogutta terrifontis TaxID=1331910 RepID=A0A286RBS7_9BACT|nr:right-handed parallel beta-helix repeat-containing protein [Thermogutta terrifontis]ASV73421.1 hypothetical protein THTE_0819 [Thermogutta terrifontis]